MNTGAEALILTCAGRLFGLFVGQANLEKVSFDYLDLDRRSLAAYSLFGRCLARKSFLTLFLLGTSNLESPKSKESTIGGGAIGPEAPQEAGRLVLPGGRSLRDLPSS